MSGCVAELPVELLAPAILPDTVHPYLFPGLPSRWPFGTWVTVSEGPFLFSPDRNLPKEAVLPFHPGASGLGPLKLLHSFFFSYL